MEHEGEYAIFIRTAGYKFKDRKTVEKTNSSRLKRSKAKDLKFKGFVVAIFVY